MIGIYFAKVICFIFWWCYVLSAGMLWALLILPLIFSLELIVSIANNVIEYANSDKETPDYYWSFSFTLWFFFCFVLLRFDLADKYV